MVSEVKYFLLFITVIILKEYVIAKNEALQNVLSKLVSRYNCITTTYRLLQELMILFFLNPNNRSQTAQANDTSAKGTPCM